MTSNQITNKLIESAMATPVVESKADTPLVGSKTAPSMDALTSTLFDQDAIGIGFSYDNFTAAIVLSIDGAGSIPLSDQHYTETRIRLERIGMNRVSKELARDAIFYVAAQNQFDSAQDWLNYLTWDGKKRVDGFLAKYFGAEVDAYACAISRYLWTALAGRVISPGCKADMVPVLVGRQGIRKSSGVKAIAPNASSFAEISLHERDDDLSRKMRGVLVAELGELRGLKSKDQESIKQFLTRTTEKWIPKYMESEVTMPRRLIFIGTTNEDEFLSDSTGNRRWLPINVEAVDVEAIERDRDQLWAEGAALFLADGVAFCDAETLAETKHADFEIQDPWKPLIERYLENKQRGTGDRELQIFTEDILSDAIQMPASQRNDHHKARIGKILVQLNFKKAQRRSQIDGKPKWCYVPKRLYFSQVRR